MKRIVMLLSVVALMVVMLAMSVAPAFAAWEANGCRTGGSLYGVVVPGTFEASKDRNGDGYVCYISNDTPQGFARTHYYDNRLLF